MELFYEPSVKVNIYSGGKNVPPSFLFTFPEGNSLQLYVSYTHGGESHDFRGLKMADSCQNPSIQVDFL